MKQSRSEFVNVRGARMHVRRWGRADAPKLFLLHGWMDVSASYQFMVDALQGDWAVLAPDWRGYGLSDWRNDKYWMYDDLADLDALLNHYSPDEPISLVGHSYGGAIASIYAGSRPERIARYVSIEGFGHRQYPLAESPQVVARWLDGLKHAPRQSVYPDREAFAKRLRAANRRLTQQRAEFLAEHFGEQRDDGRVALAADPWRKVRGVPPSFPPAQFFQTVFANVGAPALWVRTTDSHYMREVFADEGCYEQRFACLRDARDAVIDDAGHNVHHDQPERLAEVIENFLLADGRGGERALPQPSVPA